MPKRNGDHKASLSLAGGSIIIRAARKGDARGAIECFNAATRSGLNKYTGMNRLVDLKEHARQDKWYATRQRNVIEFVAIDEQNGRIVGTCNFHARPEGRTRHLGVVSWGLHPDYVGRGIATSLLKTVLKEASKRGFVRAEADGIAVQNTKSLSLARRCGFRVEGRRKRGMVLDDGRYVDTVVLGKILGQ
jgi:RimJ/RimL family protein N-acetyltransferase